MYDVQFGIFGVQILHDSSYCAYMSYPKTSEIFLDFCLKFCHSRFLKSGALFQVLGNVFRHLLQLERDFGADTCVVTCTET